MSSKRAWDFWGFMYLIECDNAKLNFKIMMMKLNVWLSAFRLRTLPLALSCIGMGGFLAASVGKFEGSIFGLCICTTVLLQILSNLANDYGDTVNGADSSDRKGPSRAVQSGALSMSAMKRAIVIFAILSLVSGFVLLYQAFGWDLQSLLFFLGLGLLSIIAAVTYTAGRKPYGYVGLGDLSVLIFFGLTGVMGSAYLFIKEVLWLFTLPALSCGLFSVAVLNINNIRDIESDKKAGKYSIPVRLGRSKAVVYHWIIVALGVLTSVVFTILTYKHYAQWLFLLALPLLVINSVGVYRYTDEKSIDPYLKQMAITTLLFVILFGIGIIV